MINKTQSLSLAIVLLLIVSIWKSDLIGLKQTAQAAGNRAYECSSLPQNDPKAVEYFARDCEVGTLVLSNSIMCCFKK